MNKTYSESHFQYQVWELYLSYSFEYHEHVPVSRKNLSKKTLVKAIKDYFHKVTKLQSGDFFFFDFVKFESAWSENKKKVETVYSTETYGFEAQFLV